MLAAWLDNIHNVPSFIDVREVEEPIPTENEALIEVLLAGVCSTDLELRKGYYPFVGVPGHEFVGRVISCIADERWVGKRVVGEINITCGICSNCLSGIPNHCTARKALGIQGHWGVFSERLTIPKNNLYAVPEDLPDESAVFTEPLAAALEIQEQVPVLPGQKVLVVGAGRLGQLVAQTLRLTGCDLTVVARHERQQNILGNCSIPWISEQDVSHGVYEIVVDTTGTPEGFAVARQAVRPRGTIVMKSTYKGDLQINLSSMVVDEITLVGSRCGPFEKALQLMESGRVAPQLLVDARYPLEKTEIALEHASQKGALKILIDPRS